jgi:hypothetical protein
LIQFVFVNGPQWVGDGDRGISLTEIKKEPLTMTKNRGQKFSDKHGSDAELDPVIKAKVIENAKDGEVACAVAFKIASELTVSPAEIGKTVDLLDLKLSKCQLGLFGYQPHKKKVTSRKPENQQVEKSIRDALVNGKLACRDAWAISARHNVAKMAVSGACEFLGIKIKPCQLGAF